MPGKMPITAATREPVARPGVHPDIRAMANEQNPGPPTRRGYGARNKAQAARDQGTRIKGQPTTEQLAVYADFISGKTQEQVAAKHGMSRNNVGNLVRKIDRWLIPQFMDDIRGIKCQHTQRLLHIVSEAMGAWERSKRDKVTFNFERVEYVDGVGDAAVTKTRLQLEGFKKEPQAGNPTFLATAMKALEDIRKVWGADAPVRMEVSGEIRVAGRTVDEARAELAQQMDDARQRLLQPANN